MEKKQYPPVYYSEYLQLDKILNAQAPESKKEGHEANDEMLFIIIHQAYELWFKLLLHEIDVVRKIFKQSNIENNSPDIYNSVHRLKRVSAILELAVTQLGIIETMTPLDFLDFRDLLRPASGFQSIQFKMVEAKLGLTFDKRFGQDYYLSQLKPEDVQRVKEAESEESLLILTKKWLERMPFLKNPEYENTHGFWETYRQTFADSLQEGERDNLSSFDQLIIQEDRYPEGRSLSQAANRNALFIILYRDYPLMQLPYELLNVLLSIDEHLALWRHRHIHMVQRTIGKRLGTGGSSGANYLRAAADSHYIFRELSELTSFLLPRKMLPKLPASLVRDLCFAEPDTRS